MATIRLPADFREFLRLLSYHRVEYLLIGGYAVCYHGYYRNTVDIDFWIAVSEDNANKLVGVFRDFGFNIPELSTDLFLRKGRMIRMGVEPMRIEIITEISGCDFRECYARRIRTTVDGLQVDVISLPDLITNKLKSGRLKDLADAQKLT